MVGLLAALATAACDLQESAASVASPAEIVNVAATTAPLEPTAERLPVQSSPSIAEPAEPAGPAGTAEGNVVIPEFTEPTGARDDSLAIAVAAAQTFLDSLSDSQRSKAVLAADDPARPNWSNLPSNLVRLPRNGVRIGDLDTNQMDAMLSFLRSSLSDDGYATAIAVVGADAVLAEAPNAARLGWSEDNYWLAFFGVPGLSNTWGWQFGGHHLALNVNWVDGRGFLSPTFIGVEPAHYQRDGVVIEPLAQELAAGLALINGLDEQGASAQAAVAQRPREVWTGAGNDDVVPDIEGSRVRDWDQQSKSQLLEAINLWVGILPDASAQARMRQIESELDDTYFAWHGDFGGSGPVYFRIQGPSLIVEFSTQGAVGSGQGHFHSIYRDPSNEYGGNRT